VEGGGRSAIVNGLPSGPITYFTLGRSASLIGLSHANATLTHP
jgi:hypothetical protein